MLEGLRKAEELMVIVVTRLSYGCPTQAIVHAFEIDERTVARWQERAGVHCQRVHYDQVVQGKLDLHHVQADEIRGKGCQMIPWIAMAMMVSTRLWLGGVVRLRRDRRLADPLLQMVKTCCLPLRAVLVLTDGWSAYPGQYSAGVSRKGQENGRAWAVSSASLGKSILIGTADSRKRRKSASST